jgi:hypothetical protein
MSKRCVTCSKHGKPAMCILYDKRISSYEERQLASIERKKNGACIEWEAKRIRRLAKYEE